MDKSKIQAVVTTVFAGAAQVSQGRTTYLRTLIEATQDSLHNKRGQDQAVQMTALNETHSQFYEIVLKVAEKYVPTGTAAGAGKGGAKKARNAELHRMATFARTSVSALREHIRADGDICALKAAAATKANLKVRAGPRKTKVSPRRLRAATETHSKRLMASLMGLANVDKPAAIEELKSLLGQVTTQLMQMGVMSTGDAGIAAAEQRPLKIGKVLFMPTESQILRRQAAAARGDAPAQAVAS